MKDKILWIGLGIITIVISGYFIFSVETIDVEVTAHDWKREIRVQDFQSRRYSSWRNLYLDGSAVLSDAFLRQFRGEG